MLLFLLFYRLLSFSLFLFLFARKMRVCVCVCRRQAQSRAFQRLATAYDQNPSDTKRLVNLMQDVQEYGQPPADLVHDIAPDLKLDAQGMPQFGQEDCRTM